MSAQYILILLSSEDNPAIISMTGSTKPSPSGLNSELHRVIPAADMYVLTLLVAWKSKFPNGLGIRFVCLFSGDVHSP